MQDIINQWNKAALKYTEDQDHSEFSESNQRVVKIRFKHFIWRKNIRHRMRQWSDFFPLDAKQVLPPGPQNMLSFGSEYHNGIGTLCLSGDYRLLNCAEDRFTM